MLHTGFDTLLEQHRGQVPLAFMRALAYRESGLDPRKSEPAAGLFQIRRTALKHYNQVHGTNWSLDDLLIPEKNVALAGWLLNLIISRWSTHPSLQPDWDSERFPALVAFGWNAGWSEKAGLALVASKLEEIKTPVSDVNVDTIRQSAIIVPNASPYLTMPARAVWAKKVAATYLRGKPQQVAAKVSRQSEGIGAGIGILLALGVGALIISRS